MHYSVRSSLFDTRFNKREHLFPFVDPADMDPKDRASHYFKLKDVVGKTRQRVNLDPDRMYEYPVIHPVLKACSPRVRAKPGKEFERCRGLPVHKMDLMVCRKASGDFGVLHALAPRSMFVDRHMHVFPLNMDLMDPYYLDTILGAAVMWLHPKALTGVVNMSALMELWIPRLDYVNTVPGVRDWVHELHACRQGLVGHWYRMLELELELHNHFEWELEMLKGTEYYIDQYGRRHTVTTQPPAGPLSNGNNKEVFQRNLNASAWDTRGETNERTAY